MSNKSHSQYLVFFLILIVLEVPNTIAGQTREEQTFKVGVSFSSSIVRLSESADFVRQMQVYSPGLYVRYGNHMVYGYYDFYSPFLFDLLSRTPEGFQLGYRYHVSNILSFAELYGEFNYAYFSYVNSLEHIRYINIYPNGIANYVYMGNLAVGARVPFADRFSVNGSIGYGASYVNLFAIATSRDAYDWRRHVYFRLELNARIWGK